MFLAVGELARYVAYLDDWPARWRIWPWATALIGLAVSVAGNIGHIHAEPGQLVLLSDRLTAATSPLAAFAGLSVGLLVLKMTREQTSNRPHRTRARPASMLATNPAGASLEHGASLAVKADALCDSRARRRQTGAGVVGRCDPQLPGRRRPGQAA